MILSAYPRPEGEEGGEPWLTQPFGISGACAWDLGLVKLCVCVLCVVCVCVGGCLL